MQRKYKLIARIQLRMINGYSLIQAGAPPPAFGDIQLRLYENDPALQGYYEVLVYYTDGLEQPSWGGICFTVTAAEAGVICRQLGYEASNVRFESGYAISKHIVL